MSQATRQTLMFYMGKLVISNHMTMMKQRLDLSSFPNSVDEVYFQWKIKTTRMSWNGKTFLFFKRSSQKSSLSHLSSLSGRLSRGLSLYWVAVDAGMIYNSNQINSTVLFVKGTTVC